MAHKSLQKLELTWIGKGNEPKLEPRILIENPEYSYGENPPSPQGEGPGVRLFPTTQARSTPYFCLPILAFSLPLLQSPADRQQYDQALFLSIRQ